MMEKSPEINPKETVILLHGIGHTGLNMAGLGWGLHHSGYATQAITYPSTRLSILDNARWLLKYRLNQDFWNHQTRVHFVCHSLGGLVVESYLNLIKDIVSHDKIGKVILLGTPHAGSPIADFLKNFILYRCFFGPAGQELTTTNHNFLLLNPIMILVLFPVQKAGYIRLRI
jgi:triacylglycerol lipase